MKWLSDNPSVPQATDTIMENGKSLPAEFLSSHFNFIDQIISSFSAFHECNWFFLSFFNATKEKGPDTHTRKE